MKLIGLNTAVETQKRWIMNRNVLLSHPHPISGARWFSHGDADSIPSAFSSQSAYEVLGVPETSSLTQIKASFRKLAKETHPDLANSTTDPDSSRRFLQILAAYEILSDAEKRTHYDMYIFAKRKPVQRKTGYGVTLHSNESHDLTYKHMEVVEWLKWYRFAIKDILSEKREVVGDGYFDVLERDFYSAVHQAYYGPAIESLDFLPDRFEAEERSLYETPEVLHLVSGRDLFGMVCIVEKFPELSFRSTFKLRAPVSSNVGISQTNQNMSISLKFDGVHSSGDTELEYGQDLQAHSNLELRLYGRTVAMATRVPPISCSKGVQNSENEDRIHVFLCPEGCSESTTGVAKDSPSDSAGSRIPLGTIAGLGSTPDEGSCFVYNSSGTKTHVIMKHRTLLVKHMHWYGVEDKVSLCECRCSRAKLPPSKFWLFEPRCGMHDIGGWYIETFGRDKKGHTVPSPRFWDGFDPSENFEKRVHPAMYLLALAYRTLDLEEAKIRKQTVLHHVERRLSKFLSWCKKLV